MNIGDGCRDGEKGVGPHDLILIHEGRVDIQVIQGTVRSIGITDSFNTCS